MPPPPKLILCPQDTTAGLPSESKYFWAGLVLASVTVIFKEPFFCLKCFCCFYEQARFPPTPHISLKFRGTSSGGAGGHYPLEMVVKGWEACRHLQQWPSWSQLCRLSQVSPSDSCLTLSSLCLVEHLPIFRSGQLSLQNSNHFFVLAILSQALHIVMSSFSLSMLGFWSVRNEIEDKHSKTTMNLRDLNQTQEAGKVFLFGLFFFLQKLGSVQMGSICTYSLPPGPFGKAHGISTCILLSCYSSPILMWFAPNSLKVVYLDMVFATGHPPTLGCISTTCRPET